MSSIKMNGFDELQRELRDLSRKVAKLNGTHSVPIIELLTPTFVSKHTRFANMEEMFRASGFRLETHEDFTAIPDDEWDEFIRSASSFPIGRLCLERQLNYGRLKLGFDYDYLESNSE